MCAYGHRALETHNVFLLLLLYYYFLKDSPSQFLCVLHICVCTHSTQHSEPAPKLPYIDSMRLINHLAFYTIRASLTKICAKPCF